MREVRRDGCSRASPILPLRDPAVEAKQVKFDDAEVSSTSYPFGAANTTIWACIGSRNVKIQDFFARAVLPAYGVSYVPPTRTSVPELGTEMPRKEEV
jgi:hypothetical protein